MPILCKYRNAIPDEPRFREIASLGAVNRQIQTRAARVPSGRGQCPNLDVILYSRSSRPAHVSGNSRILYPLHTHLICLVGTEHGPTPSTHCESRSRKKALCYNQLVFSAEHRQTLPNLVKHARWRRERDSNPRDSFPSTHFPGVRLRPLGHLSNAALLA